MRKKKQFCFGCYLDKPISEFVTNRGNLRIRCHDCINEKYLMSKFRKMRSDESYEDYVNEYYLYLEEGRSKFIRNYEAKNLKIKNPEEHAIVMKQRYKRQLYKQYNLTLEEVETQGELQNWMCFICERDISNRFHVDHDHQTRHFRGLLCFNCNVGLGNFHDSIECLKRAIEYLSRFEG